MFRVGGNPEASGGNGAGNFLISTPVVLYETVNSASHRNWWNCGNCSWLSCPDSNLCNNCGCYHMVQKQVGDTFACL